MLITVLKLDDWVWNPAFWPNKVEPGANLYRYVFHLEALVSDDNIIKWTGYDFDIKSSSFFLCPFTTKQKRKYLPLFCLICYSNSRFNSSTITSIFLYRQNLHQTWILFYFLKFLFPIYFFIRHEFRKTSSQLDSHWINLDLRVSRPPS